MGNPLHYSQELPRRCLQLIDELWPHASNTLQKDRPELGALTTTFLISMSMPIINLPLERIEQHRSSKKPAYANDRAIAPALTDEVDKILGGQVLERAPFYETGSWRFAKHAPFNVAEGLSEELVDSLSGDAAVKRASKMQTSQWCRILRNAMAHGGIAYLDINGRTSHGVSVDGYAFVSGVYDEKRGLIEVNVLRISEIHYRNFLRKWVGWLESPEVRKVSA